MATSRLTKHIKEALLKKLLHRAFKDRAQDLVDRCSAYAVRVYEDALKDHLELIRSLPDGWLPSDDDIKVQMAGDMKQPGFNGSLKGWGLESSLRAAGAEQVQVSTGNGRFMLPFPSKYKGACVKTYDAGHPLVEEFTALEHEIEDLAEEISRASRTAQAAMDSVTTVKKLIDVWPEVEEFAKAYLHDGERKAILPAIPRAELNAALGLPPEEREAA